MSAEQRKTPLSIHIPNSQTVIRTCWQHQTCVCIRFNVTNSIWVSIKHTLPFQQPWVILCICVKVNNWYLRVFSAKHKSVANLSVIFDAFAAVHCFWFSCFGLSKIIIANNKLLSRHWCYVENALISSRNYVFLIVCEIARYYDRLRFFVNKYWFFRLSNIIKYY